MVFIFFNVLKHLTLAPPRRRYIKYAVVERQRQDSYVV